MLRAMSGPGTLFINFLVLVLTKRLVAFQGFPLLSFIGLETLFTVSS